MELITTADDVEKMQGDGFFLLQCPRTELVYVMFSNRNMSDGSMYYLARQRPDDRYIVDTNYPNRTEERYYFSIERLKEMITNKSFAIER